MSLPPRSALALAFSDAIHTRKFGTRRLSYLEISPPTRGDACDFISILYLLCSPATVSASLCLSLDLATSHRRRAVLHGMSRWIRVGSVLQLTLLCAFALITTCIGKQFKYQSYAQIHWRLTELVAKYPKLLRLSSAQQTFLLPHVGNCTQLQSATDQIGVPAPCTVWVVALSNLSTLPSEPGRPEMLVSGLLHGDEVIGPHAVLAFIEHMVSNYHSDPFVKHLMDTRLVVLTPMTNAIGFFRQERTERQRGPNGSEVTYDPNRDFGFDQDPKKCMQTVAARALNELFRVHLFRVLITFHGGTNVVGYEWGDTHHCNGPMCKPAPDTGIMHALGERMSHMAGPAGQYEGAYPVGDMGKLVYPVNGGLEDWAYGASWSGQAVECRPETLGGYPKEKVKIDKRGERCVTYLVETAREKKPEEHSLGSSEDILQRGAAGDGHVPRNVRLLMSVVDALEPYIVVDEKIGTNGNNKPVISWAVRGSFIVDGSTLQWSTEKGEHHGYGDVHNGTAVASVPGGEPLSFSQDPISLFPSKTTPVYFRIAAVVDQRFAHQPSESDPNVSPQSHLMGSRASTTWSFRSGDHIIQGRQVFFSTTRKLTMSTTGVFEMTEVQGVEWGLEQGKLRSVSDTDLFSILFKGQDPKVLEPGSTGRLSTPLTVLTAAVGTLVIVCMAVAIFVFARRKRGGRTRGNRGMNSFSIADDDDEDEERRALTPIEEGTGQDEQAEEGLAVSRLRVKASGH